MRRFLAVFAAATLILTACSGDGDSEGNADDLDGLIEAVEPTAIVFDPNDPPQLAGTSIRPTSLDAGDCFNQYVFRDGSDFLQNVTTLVGCDGPHDHEAYFRTEFPGGENATYPLDDELERWADTACLDEFAEFVGLEYVLSALEIGAVIPSFEGWSNDGERTVVCYVFPDEGGRLLASVNDTGI